MIERIRLTPEARRRLRRKLAKPPNRKRLTEKNVLTLPARKKPYRVWDAGTGAASGLQVLVQPSGTKRYRVQYSLHGKGAAMKLKRVEHTTLKEARKEAVRIRGLAEDGHDPRQRTDETKQAGKFEDLLNAWNTDDQIKRLGNVSADRTLILLKSSCAHWLEKHVTSISYDDIEGLLFEKRDYAPYMANRLHGHLRTFFRWTIRTRRLTVNPMAEMLKPWNGAKPRDRPWFKKEAADQVIRDLWAFADRSKGADGAFIKLLLITGKRKGVVLGMRWADIDRDGNWAPPSGSKTKRNHPIPLPDLARTILKSCSHDKAAFLEHVRERELVELVRNKIKLPDFFWHGVRHIVETKLAELRILVDTRDMLLDHAPVRGAGKGYDHHEYRDVKLEALERWCAHITKLVDPKGGKDFN
jgi:integrase